LKQIPQGFKIFPGGLKHLIMNPRYIIINIGRAPEPAAILFHPPGDAHDEFLYKLHHFGDIVILHSGGGVLSKLFAAYEANTLRPAPPAYIALAWVGGRYGTNMAGRRPSTAAVRNNRIEVGFFLDFDTSAPPGGSFGYTTATIYSIWVV
jgi:hypothetical protein